MKLIGVAMVRNEADIVETFVRHNLARLDAMTVVDHGSTDATPAILAALVAEGLPLTVVREGGVEFQQQQVTSRVLREAISRDGADWAFPLDADEFIKTPSRANLEEVLASVPQGTHAAMAWLTYVPDFRATGLDTAALARGARRIESERHGLYKVVVSRSILEAPDMVVARGNHRMLSAAGRDDDDLPHALAHPDAMALAHLPVRSLAQFSAKVITNRLARIVAGREIDIAVYHLSEPYRMLRDGVPLTPDYLAMVAVNYSTPRNAWMAPESIRLVDDPFLLPLMLRYTPLAPVDPLALVARLAERM